MATAWSDVITAAMQVINDDRWHEQLDINPAQFFRAKSDTLAMALPLLNSPPELLTYIESDITEPSYDSGEWVSDENSLTGETQIDTGIYGSDIFSCVLRCGDGTEWLPYTGAEYDADTGIVTFPQQDEAGLVYEYDFYSDGSLPDLSRSQLRLLALAVAVVWDEHFERTFLDITPKINDSSFSTVNEANYLEKSNRRLRDNRQSFNEELHKYEQMCAYLNTTRGGNRNYHLA